MDNVETITITRGDYEQAKRQCLVDFIAWLEWDRNKMICGFSDHDYDWWPVDDEADHVKAFLDLDEAALMNMRGHIDDDRRKARERYWKRQLAPIPNPCPKIETIPRAPVTLTIKPSKPIGKGFQAGQFPDGFEQEK